MKINPNDLGPDPDIRQLLNNKLQKLIHLLIDVDERLKRVERWTEPKNWRKRTEGE